MMKRKYLLSVVAAVGLIAVLVIGCSPASISPTIMPTSVPTPTPPTPTVPPPPGIGDVVSGEVWEIEVISAETINSVQSYMGGTISPKPGYSFVVVKTSIKNTTSEAQVMKTDASKLVDHNGGAHEAIGVETEEGSRVYRLSGGGRVETYVPGGWASTRGIVFVVPESAKEFLFQFEDLPTIDLMR